jgi:hypothetical protein
MKYSSSFVPVPCFCFNFEHIEEKIGRFFSLKGSSFYLLFVSELPPPPTGKMAAEVVKNRQRTAKRYLAEEESDEEFLKVCEAGPSPSFFTFNFFNFLPGVVLSRKVKKTVYNFEYLMIYNHTYLQYPANL